MIRVDARQRDGVSILDLTGKLAEGVDCKILRDAVAETLDTGARKILVKLQHVSTADEAGIAAPVHCHLLATNRGVPLKLCALPPKIDGILTLTGIGKVLDIERGEDDAMESFA